VFAKTDPDAGHKGISAFLAENMEGSAVAQTCLRFGIPVMECRGISNQAGDRRKDHWRMDQAITHCHTVVYRWLSGVPGSEDEGRHDPPVTRNKPYPWVFRLSTTRSFLCPAHRRVDCGPLVLDPFLAMWSLNQRSSAHMDIAKLSINAVAHLLTNTGCSDRGAGTRLRPRSGGALPHPG
jgi:hypothetical protein